MIRDFRHRCKVTRITKEGLFSAEGTGELFLGIQRRKRVSVEGVLCRKVLKKKSMESDKY